MSWLKKQSYLTLTLIPCQSVSDDSMDLGSSKKQSCAKSGQKSAPKPAVSWWQDDEHSGGGTGRGNNEERTPHNISSITLNMLCILHKEVL